MSDKTKRNLKIIGSYFYRILLGAFIGVICGGIGALFSRAIQFVTALRGEHGWVLYLLPLGGILTVLIYKICKTQKIGTSNALRSAVEEKEPPVTLFPAIFSGTLISHFLGASAGKEGATLQLGSVVSSVISKIISVDEETRRILAVCGMGGMFSAVFGTPVGACVFAIEILKKPKFGLKASLPTLVSCVSSFFVAEFLGAHAERFSLTSLPAINFDSLWKTAVLGVAVGVVALVFCTLLHQGEKVIDKIIKNPFIKVVIGAAAVILLTHIVGNNDYNGGGIFVIERIFESETVHPAAFLLKIIFTVISVAAGFKGGEIVPSLFIGATSGGVFSQVLGLSASFGAATGMAAIFAAVTNCPIASFVMCMEMMGAEGALFFLISSVIAHLVAKKVCLFSAKPCAEESD